MVHYLFLLFLESYRWIYRETWLMNMLAWSGHSMIWSKEFWKKSVLESGLSSNPATFDQSPIMTAASLHTGTSTNITSKLHNSSTKKPCVFCKSVSHPPTKCDKIVDHQKCIDFIKKKNICFNCFGHHKASRCNSKYRYKHCKRKYVP